MRSYMRSWRVRAHAFFSRGSGEGRTCTFFMYLSRLFTLTRGVEFLASTTTRRVLTLGITVREVGSRSSSSTDGSSLTRALCEIPPSAQIYGQKLLDRRRTQIPTMLVKFTTLSQCRHSRNAPVVNGNARRNTDVERLGQAIHGDGESAVAEREQLRAHAELFVAKDERSRPRKIDLL